MHIESLHDEFGAKVTDIDLSETPSGPRLEAIRDLIDTYAFVWFPDQPFTDDRQLALTAALGEPEPSHVAYGEAGKIEYFGTIGNVQADGTALGNDTQKIRFLKGNNMWHSDSSFRDVPSFVSIMCAYETPSEGGETLFVSARSAWDRLDQATQDQLDPLIGIHDYTYSRSKVAEVAESLSKSLPPVRQRLVRTNPANGRKNLFIGSHLREIEGWGYEKSRPFLDGMIEEVTAPQHVYSHAWAPGDLVIWDNRCLIHRGAGYDADAHRRYMRQTRVRGSGPTLSE